MRTLYRASVVLALGVLGSAAEANAQKVGYLNSERILREVPGGQQVEQQMQQEATRLQTRIQAMRDSLQSMIEEYNRQSVLLSPEEKKKREDAIRAREAQMQQRAQILQEEMTNRQRELMGPIMKKIEDVIEVVRKEGGYAIIFDSNSGAMVSADSTLDVTSLVIAKLKAEQGTGAQPNGKSPGSGSGRKN